MEDGLLDLLLSAADREKIDSLQKVRVFVDLTLWSWIEKTDALVAQDIVSKFALKMWMYYSSKSVPEDTILSKLLKVTKISDNSRSPMMVLHREEGIQHLTIKMPNLDPKNEAQMTNLGHLLSFASSLLSLTSSSIHLLMDSALGTEVLLSASQQKLIDSLKASSSSPKGIFPGESYSFKSGFKSNLIGLLAAMRVLTTKQEYIRRRPSNSPKVALQVTSYQDLLEMFNIRSGLKSDNLTYSQNFVKNILNLVVKPSNTSFPGGWLYSVREQNGVQTDTGLLFKLGYTEKLSTHHKLMDVIFNTVTENDSKLTIHNNKTEPLSFLEFRSSVAVSAPKLKADSDISMKNQISVDPLKVRDHLILDAFADPERIAAIDRLNVAYALKISCASKKSKTTPVHYQQARNAFLHSTARCKLRDASKEYEKFSDFPESVQGFLRKEFRFPVNDKKRKVDDTEKPIIDVNMTEGQDPSSIQTTPQEIVFKKAKLSDKGGSGVTPAPPPPPLREAPRRRGAGRGRGT